MPDEIGHFDANPKISDEPSGLGGAAPHLRPSRRASYLQDYLEDVAFERLLLGKAVSVVPRDVGTSSGVYDLKNDHMNFSWSRARRPLLSLPAHAGQAVDDLKTDRTPVPVPADRIRPGGAHDPSQCRCRDDGVVRVADDRDEVGNQIDRG